MEYIVFILFMGIMSFIEVLYFKKKNKIFFILVIILYILFFGNRGIIGFDLGHYYPNFHKIPNIFEMISNMRFKYCEYDIGFQIYIGILKVFISDFNTFIFITTMIDGVLMYLVFYSFSLYPVTSLFIFIGLNGMIMQINLLRNIKPIFIFLYSLKYLKNSRIKYFGINILNLLLHHSSIIYLFIYKILKYKKIKRNFLILFFIIGLLINIGSINILTVVVKGIYYILIHVPLTDLVTYKIKYYIEYENFIQMRPLTFNIVEKIGTFILIIRYAKEFVKYKYAKIFFNLYFIYLIIYLYCRGIAIIYDRFEIIFIVSYCFIYPIVLKKVNKMMKLVIIMCLLLYSLRIVSENILPFKELEYRNEYFIKDEKRR